MYRDRTYNTRNGSVGHSPSDSLGSSFEAWSFLAFISAFLRNPSAFFLSRLAAASSHSSPSGFIFGGGTVIASRNALRNLAIRLVFSTKRSLAICTSVWRYCGGTSRCRRPSTWCPMRDSKAKPMERMATIGVAASLPVDMIFKAPDSRKPACRAQRRRSCAWLGEAVRTWRIYESLSFYEILHLRLM